MGCGSSSAKPVATTTGTLAPHERPQTVFQPPEAPHQDVERRRELERRETERQSKLKEKADAAQLMRENQGAGLVQSLMDTMGPSQRTTFAPAAAEGPQATGSPALESPALESLTQPNT